MIVIIFITCESVLSGSVSDKTTLQRSAIPRQMLRVQQVVVAMMLKDEIESTNHANRTLEPQCQSKLTDSNHSYQNEDETGLELILGSRISSMSLKTDVTT